MKYLIYNLILLIIVFILIIPISMFLVICKKYTFKRLWEWIKIYFGEFKWR